MKLPEFRVTLTRLGPGEVAYPLDDETYYDYLGKRSKFGGEPDWIHGECPTQSCNLCGKPMTFVAQIDSLEHFSPTNPNAVDSLSEEQKWMFGDVGMLYVFYCFDCGYPLAMTDHYYGTGKSHEV